MEVYAGFEGEDACARAVGLAVSLADFLRSGDAADLDHAEVEERVQAAGWEISRLMVQGHLDERARRERRLAVVVDVGGIVHRRVERGHQRRLGTVFGPVTVTRLAYRAPGAANLYPADEQLNLPAGRYSYPLRRRLVGQAVAGSFSAAGDAVFAGCGVRVGKRQAQEVAVAAAADVAAFYAQAPVADADDDQVLVLTFDGKGVVMLPAALRARTAAKAAATPGKMLTRLASGEKLGRKRMAQVAGVYDLRPQARTAAEVISVPGQDRPPRRAGPRAAGKWLTASVVHSIPQVIAAGFDQAQRRDPHQRRVWVAVVDGNLAQIERIETEAAQRNQTVHVVIDFVHVLEYVWQAARGFYRDGDQSAETWVALKARQILSGHTEAVITAITDQADAAGLTGTHRKLINTAVTYLTNKAQYLINYPTALAQGWPIATGVIEGACRYLVKDRMDITGARWGLTSAEAVLALRAVTTNGDFDAYWAFHLEQERHRNHQSRYLNGLPPERSTH